MPCQTMPHSDEHVVTLCPTLEPLLKAKEHIYENTTQEDSKREPPLYPTPYCARYKRPQEHSDDTEKEYVYAVVDKTRAKKTNDEVIAEIVMFRSHVQLYFHGIWPWENLSRGVSNLSIHRYLGIIIHVARKTLYTRGHSPIINYHTCRAVFVK